MFYDKFIEQESNEPETTHKNLITSNNMQTLFDSKIEKIYSDMKINYEQFESITESDIDAQFGDE